MTVLLVVAVTKAKGNNCVGAIDPQTGESFRLLDSTGEFQPSGTFTVGGLYDVQGARPGQVRPPHVEDFWVTSSTPCGTVQNVKGAILQVETPWAGALMGPDVYEGKLGWTGNGHGFINASRIPAKSTWFWVTDRDLILQSNGKHFAYSNTPYEVPFVGVATAPASIRAGTLVRLSLARWWAPEGSDFEERCYLQLSWHY